MSRMKPKAFWVLYNILGTTPSALGNGANFRLMIVGGLFWEFCFPIDGIVGKFSDVPDILNCKAFPIHEPTADKAVQAEPLKTWLDEKENPDD